MSTFVFVHGAGDAAGYWHLVEAALRSRGHRTAAPDLPCDDETAGLDYVRTVVDAAGGRQDVVVEGQSYGAYPATLAADRLSARLLVLVAGMIPAPGESPGQWWPTPATSRPSPSRPGSTAVEPATTTRSSASTTA